MLFVEFKLELEEFKNTEDGVWGLRIGEVEENLFVWFIGDRASILLVHIIKKREKEGKEMKKEREKKRKEKLIKTY